MNKRSIISFVVSLIIFAMAVVIFVAGVFARKNNDAVNFFGYSFSLVVTDSMEPEIHVNDLIVVKHCKFEEASVGENVVFIAGISSPVHGKRVVHRAIEQGVDEKGEYFITKGVKDGASVDADRLYEMNFIGVEVFHSSILGWIVQFFQLFGVPIIIFACLIPFVIKQIRKIIKLSKESE